MNGSRFQTRSTDTTSIKVSTFLCQKSPSFLQRDGNIKKSNDADLQLERINNGHTSFYYGLSEYTMISFIEIDLNTNITGNVGQICSFR